MLPICRVCIAESSADGSAEVLINPFFSTLTGEFMTVDEQLLKLIFNQHRISALADHFKSPLNLGYAQADVLIPPPNFNEPLDIMSGINHSFSSPNQRPP